MQNVAATTTIVNDSGLVRADQIPAFRAYLEESGLQVRDAPGAGQFFHVRSPDNARWLPIERGRAGAPVTPQVLRSYVDGFLRTPLDSAVGQVRAQRQAAERAVARAALAQPTAVDVPAGNSDAPLVLFAGVKEGKDGPEVRVSSRQGQTLTSPDDAQYLSDLRDDFAVHAPNLGHFANVGDLAELVRLRWEYADLMMAARTTQAGD